MTLAVVDAHAAAALEGHKPLLGEVDERLAHGVREIPSASESARTDVSEPAGRRPSTIALRSSSRACALSPRW